ncbi:MAG: cytidylate kinase-like family protein [Thermodesulfovibrionales bacterium]|nr:cytidylate kinase-like family protein [Thermodesulfovibrionales bacterium]
MEKTHNIVITVSRQVASGGTYIAHAVAKKLGVKYVDTEILYKAATFLGVDARELEVREERVSGFIENILRTCTFGSPEAAYVPPPIKSVNDADLFEVESRIMREIAANCNAVIVGRAGFNVLKDHPGLVKVFIHAPLNFRIKRIMETHRFIDMDEARSAIEESNRMKTRFIRNFAGVEWTDARNYHLCIDTSATGFEEAIDMMIKLVARIRYNLELRQGG